MRSVSQEEPRDKEGSMSGRDGGGVGASSSSLAAGAAAAAAVAGSPHHIRRDGSGIAPGIARLAMAQRQRQQQRKHPEPLRRAVADCLSATHHASTPMFPSEAVRTIQDYLANPVTVDSAYSVLIDHALAERDRSPPVITKCVALLKKYLFRYVPRPSTLQQIDAFCVGLIAESNAGTGHTFKKSTPWGQPASEPASLFINSNAPHVTTSTLASAALVKSLNYVRALVQRHLPQYPHQGFTGGTMPTLTKPLPVLVSPRQGGLKWSMSEDREMAKAVARGISGLEEIEDEDQQYIAIDVLRWRWVGGKTQLAWAPSPVMMDSGGIARPHVQCMPSLAEQGAAALMLKGMEFKESDLSAKKQGDKLKPANGEGTIVDQLLRPSTMTNITDHATTRSHLCAIAATKRKSHPSQRWDGDGAASTIRRRARPLFQYRHYSEQQPLRLSEAEMEEVVLAVCAEAALSGSSGTLPVGNQTGKLGVEAADVAASVLIKLLIDMYMADSRTSAPLTLSLLQGMLSSEQAAVRVRAFDLVLNLGVHAHLLEPMQSEDQASREEASSVPQSAPPNGGSFSLLPEIGTLPSSDRGRLYPSGVHEENGGLKASIEKPERGTPLGVGEFEVWLLDILCEMLLFLVQSEEMEEGVWASALSCLLYMVCDRGRIQRQRLNGLDIRVLKALLDVSWVHAWADEVHSRIIRMACNLLYCLPALPDVDRSSKPKLDMEQLSFLGGIESICIEYARARAAEAKWNLFAVLFDYIVHNLCHSSTLTGRQSPGVEEIQAVATTLALAEAPESFALAFKQGLQGVGETITKSIVTAMSRDVTNGRLNAQLLEDITRSLDILASAHTHPDVEFEQLIKVTMVSEGLTSGDVSRSSALARDMALDPTLVSNAWATLHALLHSSQALCRSNGYSWLLELLAAEMACGGSKQSSKFNTHALQRQISFLGSLERAAESEASLDGNHLAISSSVRLLCGLLKSNQPVVRRGFVLVLEKLLLQCQRPGLELEIPPPSGEGGETKDGLRTTGAQGRALAMLGLMNGALWQVISANDTDRINILQMCNMMFSQLCVKWPILPTLSPNAGQQTLSFDQQQRHSLSNGRLDMASNFEDKKPKSLESDKPVVETRSMMNTTTISNIQVDDSSMVAMLLNGQAAAPKLLVANMPTALLYWPLMQLAASANDDVALGIAVGSRGGGTVHGGTCDVRAALLLLLIGKCNAYQAALDEVGGEEFFRSLLDDSDARIAYYTSAFLLKRMMREEPEMYQRMLHNLVFKAQQSNNEKLLENPFLQMLGILQLLSENGTTL